MYGPQYRCHQPGGAGKATSGLEECQQVGVELVFVRVRETVGCARGDQSGAQSTLYSVVLPSKCSLSASASSRVR
jgi:hypothetical protein